MGTLECAREEQECNGSRDYRSDCGHLFLHVVPIEIFQHEDPYSSQKMHEQEKNKPAFRELDQGGIAPTQKALKPRFAFDRKPERQEMQRQEDGQRETGEPVDEGGNPEHARAMRQEPARHGDTTAATARSPNTRREHPSSVPRMSDCRSLSDDHSLHTSRTPMAA